MERAARFILQKPTHNGMLNGLHTAFRVMQTRWMRLGLSIQMNPSDGVVCWNNQFLSLTWWTGPNYESLPCAENVFPEQSQALQQAEVLAADANRTLAQARSVVASAKQHRSGVFPSSNAPSSRKGQRQGQGERQIEIFFVSHLWPKRSFLETVS